MKRMHRIIADYELCVRLHTSCMGVANLERSRTTMETEKRERRKNREQDNGLQYVFPMGMAGYTTRGLAMHRARWCRPGQRPVSRRGQLVDKAVKLWKREASAALLLPVVMDGESLESVYQFDYLGCRFTGHAEYAADMRPSHGDRGRAVA